MTHLDKQWIDRNGIVLLRFRKPDGGWHRASIMPGQDAEKTMEAVNAHLQQMGHTVVGEDDLSVIRNTIQVEHTAERISTFRAMQTELTAAKE